MPRRIASDVTLERDVPVHMSDGVQLMANVFRSFPPRRSPVLMSVTPYGKDVLPDRRGMLLMRLSGTRFGHLDCSAWTGFEAPDPLFWVRAGYAVVQADVRGMHKSEGRAGVLSDRDAQDYYELIEWAAGQSWSTGAVGLHGVSYLAMSQWRVAALRPPSLGPSAPGKVRPTCCASSAIKMACRKRASSACGGGSALLQRRWRTWKDTRRLRVSM